ncbi:hypothetical protein TNCV_2859651 [Trichonephila clavipes]|nr:hypothetical protein TNCV_2859651 [Trichonephila clavipes]
MDFTEINSRDEAVVTATIHHVPASDLSYYVPENCDVFGSLKRFIVINHARHNQLGKSSNHDSAPASHVNRRTRAAIYGLEDES